MENTHRQLLQSNLIALSHIGPNSVRKLYSLLKRDGIIDEAFIEDLSRNYPGHKEQAYEFFLRLRMRGPKAFDTLVSALYETGHVNEAKLLQPQLQNCNNASNQSVISIHPEPTQSSSSNPVVIPNKASNIKNGHGDIRPFIDYLDPNVTDDSYMKQLPDKEYLDMNVKLATSYNCGKFVDTYPMMSRPRGFSLILNNIFFTNSNYLNYHREGACVDTVNLVNLFTALGFSTIVRHNVSRSNLIVVLDEFKRQFSMSTVDACIVVIMSHGVANDVLMTDEYVNIWDDIIDKFTNQNCRALIGKPKLFFTQCCLGGKHDKGISRITETDIGISSSPSSTPTSLLSLSTGKQQQQQTNFPTITKIVSNQDILLGYATVPGYVSNRDSISGCWYIRTICEVFSAQAHNTELKKLLDKVGSRMEEIESEFGTKQMSTYLVVGFNKDLYFNPGLYEDLHASTTTTTTII